MRCPLCSNRCHLLHLPLNVLLSRELRQCWKASFREGVTISYSWLSASRSSRFGVLNIARSSVLYEFRGTTLQKQTVGHDHGRRWRSEMEGIGRTGLCAWGYWPGSQSSSEPHGNLKFKWYAGHNWQAKLNGRILASRAPCKIRHSIHYQF